MSNTRPTIAYLAGAFPVLSETFVYREVRGLRERGWNVRTAALNPSKQPPVGLNDLAKDVAFAYGARAIPSMLRELVAHPIRSCKTLSLAIGNALRPGDPTPINSRLKLLPQAFAAIGLAQRLRGIAHVHCHFAHAPTSVGMYLAAQLGIPFSFTGHANDIFQRRAILKRKLARAAFVACISQWHREFYQAILGEIGDKYRVIRCGVPTSSFSRTSANSVEARACSPCLHVLTICRLVEKKGVDTLIRALDELQRRHKISWKLTIAGEGPNRARLLDLSQSLNCADEIEWLGAVENDRVNLLLQDADVFALPCRTDAKGDRDGIPVVLMEAMACGVPVVAGDLPAIRELIENGASGLLTAGENSAALADALARIARDSDLRASLSAAGRRRVLDEFSLERNLDRLEEALLGAIDGQCAPSAGEKNDADCRRQSNLTVGA